MARQGYQRSEMEPACNDLKYLPERIKSLILLPRFFLICPVLRASTSWLTWPKKYLFEKSFYHVNEATVKKNE